MGQIAIPYILLLTQDPVFVWFDGTIIIVYFYYQYPLNYVLQCLLVCYVSWLCMVINIGVHYNVGLLPDIVLLLLLTQGYYHHRGTRLNTVEDT